MDKDLSEIFWNASLPEIKQGYVLDDGAYICLVCGRTFEKGVIYPAADVLYEAEKYAQVHVEQEHSSMFSYLLGLDKKMTGLTDLQKQLLDLFKQGKNDNEIVKELGGGSTSTIRNHRFALREKAKQAKVFLAMMEMLEETAPKQSKFITIHRTATMVDERYAITEKENEEILRSYFPDGPEGQLTEFPKKEKRKIAILKHIMKRFDPQRKYTEKEVNEILTTAYSDYATLRRHLIEYGFMDRKADGSCYWLKR